jgi:IrrE N-terminal-like domain
MKMYRGPEGDERIWFEPAEIENIMEDELHRAGLWPTQGAPAVDVEAFIEGHLKASLDQYADLDRAVLGLTEFRQGVSPLVRINRDLTGSAMDAEWCPPGIHGRWRATLAHEACHVVLHRMLVEVNPDQTALFEEHGRAALLLRCLKREVTYRSGGRNWREVQANRGMAALLMPKPLFLRAANEELHSGRRNGFDGATRRLAARFAVSKEATGIRLTTLGFRETDSDSELFA